MTIPSVTLPYGYLFVYGRGVNIGIYGNEFTNQIFKFATIYGVGVNMGTSIIGQSVGFDTRGVVCELAWENYPYSVVEATAIIATEIPVPVI